MFPLGLTSRSTPGPKPHHNPGAWIFLLAVFMSGMLFQACVPRLCQKGVQVGGSCLKRAKACWRWLETAAAKTMRERSARHSTRQRSLSGIRDPGTPMSTEQTSQRYLSLTEIRAPKAREAEPLEEIPSSSLGTKRKAEGTYIHNSRKPENDEKRAQPRFGGNDGCRKPKEMKESETKVTLQQIGKKAKDRAWVLIARKDFIKKFYAPSTLAT